MFLVENIRSFTRINFDQDALRLAGIALASLAIYALAFFLPANLFENFSRTRLEIRLLSSGGVLAYARMVLVFSALGLLYVYGYRTAHQSQSRAAWVIVISAAFLFALVQLFSAPFDAADIYDNIFHGRISGVYAGNPYQQVIADYPQDPFYEYAAWKHTPSAYGPLWELLAGSAASWAGDGIIANVLIFKILPGLFYIASVVIVWLLLRQTQPEMAMAGVLLIAWNPVILYETWGNGHNDMVMAVWILVAVWCLYARRYSLAVLALTAGALIKFIPLLLIPAAFVVGWKNQEKTVDRYQFLIKTMVAVSVLVVLAYFPFWTGGSLLNVARRAHLFSSSIPAVLYKALRPALGVEAAGYLLTVVSLCVLGLFVLNQSLRLSSKPDTQQFLKVAFKILVFYLMVTCMWFQQWYALWLITLAALLPKRARFLALFFGFWVLSKQFVFGPLIVRQIVQRPEWAVSLEALMTIGVLGPTWIYALYSLKKTSHQLRKV